MTDHFFYHSFPRRRGDDQIGKGLEMLRSMCSSGLLLTPEIIKWRYEHVNGSPPRIEELFQSRVCFTELPTKELREHCTKFGDFSIEYDISTLKKMGAMPVFYIPLSYGENTSLPGSVIVIQMIDALNFMTTLNGVYNLKGQSFPQKLLLEKNWPQNPGINKTFEIDTIEAFKLIEAVNHGFTPLGMLTSALNSISNLFYPADDIEHDRVLDYYRQREWRICLNVSYDGVTGMLRGLTEEEKENLLHIDSSFFGKSLQVQYRQINILENSSLFSNFNGRNPIEFARRIIVPPEAKESSIRIISNFEYSIEVVGINEI